MDGRPLIRCFLVLWLSAVPAFATVDGWPALHDVIGVAAEDSLNIRAEPDATSEVIGLLEAEAVGVEVIRPSEDMSWGLVSTGERMGWVFLSYLARHPGQWDGLYPDFTTCSGTEPFWHLVRTGAGLEFSGLDLPKVSAQVNFTESSLGHRGRHSFQANDMIGVLSNETCNDGMSDREFGWELNLIVLTGAPHQRHYVGCCTIQRLAK